MTDKPNPVFRLPASAAHAYYKLLAEVLDVLNDTDEVRCLECGSDWTDHPDIPDFSVLLEDIRGALWAWDSSSDSVGHLTNNEGAMS